MYYILQVNSQTDSPEVELVPRLKWGARSFETRDAAESYKNAQKGSQSLIVITSAERHGYRLVSQILETLANTICDFEEWPLEKIRAQVRDEIESSPLKYPDSHRQFWEPLTSEEKERVIRLSVR